MQVTLEASKLKEEGDRLFGRKEYQKALDAYDRALKRSTSDVKEERALLHANKAACYLMFQRCAPKVPAAHCFLTVAELSSTCFVRNAKVQSELRSLGSSKIKQELQGEQQF